MNMITRILFLIGSVMAIGFVLWISITLLGFFLLVGGALVIAYAIRQLLLDKGILNPTPGVPMDAASFESSTENTTIIDTEFTRVEDNPEKLPPQQ